MLQPEPVTVKKMQPISKDGSDVQGIKSKVEFYSYSSN